MDGNLPLGIRAGGMSNLRVALMVGEAKDVLPNTYFNTKHEKFKLPPLSGAG
jgi:hypothetical protein